MNLPVCLNLHQQDGGDYLVHNIKYDNTNFAKNLKDLVKKSNIRGKTCYGNEAGRDNISINYCISLKLANFPNIQQVGDLGPNMSDQIKNSDAYHSWVRYDLSYDFLVS